jgi:rare lipoprotein A
MMKRLASFTLSVICIAAPSFADQVVRATWYGNELRGHRTASGETFNPGGRTAAHKSLPFGTCLVVGNPKTGRKVAVRVNDRGPFTPGVTLDLSSGAAQAIGMRSTQAAINLHKKAAWPRYLCRAISCKVACLDSPPDLRAINCKDYAVSSLCKSRERTEDKQPESTAAVGAAIPPIRSCDAV